MTTYSPTPVSCDTCNRDFSEAVGTLMFDAKTRMGPWACMCDECFMKYGYGLGTGRGQRYVRQADGKFHKDEVQT